MKLELEDSFINDLTALNLRWVRDRITRMWPHWVKGAKEFEKEGSLRRQHHAKKVAVSPGFSFLLMLSNCDDFFALKIMISPG